MHAIEEERERVHSTGQHNDELRHCSMLHFSLYVTSSGTYAKKKKIQRCIYLGIITAFVWMNDHRLYGLSFRSRCHCREKFCPYARPPTPGRHPERIQAPARLEAHSVERRIHQRKAYGTFVLMCEERHCFTLLETCFKKGGGLSASWCFEPTESIRKEQ